MENNVLTEAQDTQQQHGCVNCGNPAIVHGFPTKLCHECREAFIKFPIPKWLWLFAAALGIVLLFSLFTLPKNIATGIALEKGKKAEMQHRYISAQKEFAKVVEKEPAYIEGQGHLMKAAFYNLDFPTFGKAFSEVQHKKIEDQSLYTSLDQIVQEAENYFPGDSLRAVLGKYDSVKTSIPDDLLSAFISSHSNDIYAKMMLASSLFEKKNYTVCDSLCNNIIEKDAEFIPALRLMASSEREMGDYTTSLRHCDKLLSINRENSYAMASRARTLLKQKKDKEGLEQATAAFDIDKKDGYCIATLALAYHLNGNTGKRDELINGNNKDSLVASYMKYTLDIINNKEKFRD